MPLAGPVSAPKEVLPPAVPMPKKVEVPPVQPSPNGAPANTRFVSLPAQKKSLGFTQSTSANTQPSPFATNRVNPTAVSTRAQ